MWYKMVEDIELIKIGSLVFTMDWKLYAIER